MSNFICITCGTQFAETQEPPPKCPICLDERQYVGLGGQQWTTLEQLQTKHRNSFKRKELNLYGIGTAPDFAIGQRALLVRTPGGNVLWDCISLIDDATVDLIQGLGGLKAIAISHPHYYTTMVEWSRRFGGIPIYLHSADREWVMRPDEAIRFWEGEAHSLMDGLTLIRCGGHFEGGSVLHWADGAEGKGAILAGDILQVVPDRRYVSFMRSYPNLIPLPAPAIQRIVDAVEPFAFDRIYGAWWHRNVLSDAKEAVKRSASRYLAAIGSASAP